MAVTRNYPKVNYPQLIIKAYSVQRPNLITLPANAKSVILWGAIVLALYILVSALLLPELRPQNILVVGQLWVSLWRMMSQATQVVMDHYLFAIL